MRPNRPSWEVLQDVLFACDAVIDAADPGPALRKVFQRVTTEVAHLPEPADPAFQYLRQIELELDRVETSGTDTLALLLRDAQDFVDQHRPSPSTWPDAPSGIRPVLRSGPPSRS